MGNALMASTQPLFARHVIGLTTPVYCSPNCYACPCVCARPSMNACACACSYDRSMHACVYSRMHKQVGPALGGLIPALDAKWQFSAAYLVFYAMGALSGPLWAERTGQVGPVRTLRLAFVAYGLGCLMLPLLPGGLVAAALPRMGGLEVVAGALSEPVSKFGLFLLVFAWNGFCLGGMVALPDLIVAEV